MIFKGEDILRLIPQRNPFVMVDEFEERDADNAQTALVVDPRNYFILPDGTMAETGLIEHAAQSCSALAGYQVLNDENAGPPIGILAEVKHFTCHRRPKCGEKICTTVSYGLTFGKMKIARGVSTVDSEPIAEVELKIYMQ